MKQEPQKETGKKNIYAPPHLVHYGDVRKLTQSGTQGVPEAGAQAKTKKA